MLVISLFILIQELITGITFFSNPKDGDMSVSSKRGNNGLITFQKAYLLGNSNKKDKLITGIPKEDKST